MGWLNLDELGTAYGMAIGFGALAGSLIALFNSWKP